MNQNVRRSFVIALSLFICHIARSNGESAAALRDSSIQGAPSLRDTLALTFSYQEFVLEDLRRLGISVGISHYSPDLSSLRVGHELTFDPSIDFQFEMSAKVALTHGVCLEVIGATDIAGDIDYSNISILVLYERSLLRRFKGNVGIGVSQGSFHYDTNSFVSDGGTDGVLATVGVEYVASPRTGVELYANYWKPREISTDFNNAHVSLQFKGLLIGVRCRLYL